MSKTLCLLGATITLAITLALGSLAVHAVPVDEFKLIASDATMGGRFGASASIDGDTAIVGASPFNPPPGTEPAAYIFVRSGVGFWSEQAKLTPSGGTPGGFGHSVAIHGDTAIVGAPGTSGAAYVFVRSGNVWIEQTKLTPTDGAPNDRFGNEVAIHGDTVIVGAPSPVVGSQDPGAAYVFVRDGNLWHQEQKLIAVDGVAGDRFGNSVTVDGDIAIVGAPLHDEAAQESGSAYVFVPSGTSWSQEQELTAIAGTSFDHFGRSVSLSANTAMIGAPGISTFDSPSGSGSAYVFVRQAGAWIQQAELVASGAAVDKLIGLSVAIDGDKAVVAALLYDQPLGVASDVYAYVFVRDEGVWTEEEKLVTGSGFNIVMTAGFVDISGCTIIVGTELDDDAAVDAGAAYAYLMEDCPCVDPVTGMVGWWPLDDVASPAQDKVGSNDGVWVNGPLPIAGVVDGALSFDSDQVVEVPHHPSFSFGADGDFTLDAWIMPAAVVPEASIISKFDLATGRGYRLRLVDGRLVFVLSDGSGTAPSFVGPEIPLDSWTFVAVTVNRSTDSGTVYVNGAVAGSFMPSDTASGNIDNSQPLLIASRGDHGRYVGAIDEVEVFDAALKPAEIALIHDSLSGGKCKPCIEPPDGLAAWWPFDETAGTISEDVAGPNDGEHAGSPGFASGKVAGALEFNGVGQRVKVADHPSLDFGTTGSFSIDVWIRPEEVEDLFSVIVEKWDPDNRLGYRLIMRSGTLVFTMNDGSSATFSYISPNKIPKRWTFVAVTVDRSADIGTVFVDDVIDGTFVPSNNTTGSGNISNAFPLFIGGNPQGESFPGRVDELEIFKRALDASEVHDLFVTATAGKCKPLPGDQEGLPAWAWIALVAALVAALIAIWLALLRRRQT